MATLVRLKATLQKLESYLKASGRYQSVSVGEPASAPDGFHASLLLAPDSIGQLNLTATHERRGIIVRFYLDALAEPTDETEYKLDAAYAELVEDVLGDFDLGGTIRNVDPVSITFRPGYQTLQGKLFRIADVSMALEIDDSAALTP